MKTTKTTRKAFMWATIAFFIRARRPILLLVFAWCASHFMHGWLLASAVVALILVCDFAGERN